MKILHICDHLKVGGAEKIIVEMSLRQRQSGHDVGVLLLKSTDSVWERQLMDSGVTVEWLIKKGSIYNPVLSFKIARYLKKADLVHVHLFPAQYWVAMARWMTGTKVPIITTEHSTSNRRRRNKCLKVIDRFVYKQFACAVACADEVYASVKDDYASATHWEVIPNGVDVDRYHSAQPYGKDELLGVSRDAFCIAMVSRFIYPKDQHILIEAVAECPEAVHAVLVGDGPQRESCEQLAARLGVSDRVHFLGNRNDVDRILRTCDAAALISEYEGLSLASIEGMAAGAFIGSDVKGISSIVGGAGILVKNDSRLVSEAIVSLMHDDYREIISRQCLERAKCYDINRMVDKYMHLYQAVLNDGANYVRPQTV